MLTSNVASGRVSRFDVYLYYRNTDEKYQRCFSHRINVRQFDAKLKIIFYLWYKRRKAIIIAIGIYVKVTLLSVNEFCGC